MAGLLLLCFALAFGTGPAMTYFEAAARALHDPATYIGVVLPGARP